MDETLSVGAASDRRNDTRSLPRRIGPLDGRYASGAGVVLSPVAPRTRLSLRAAEAAIEECGRVLALALPRRPKQTVASDGGGGDGRRAALWLGPDEWLILQDADASENGIEAGEDLATRLAAVADTSVVDISHRNTAMRLEGPAAEATVSAGCPQDIRLRSFPVGAASRTVFGKAEIVLWRTGETTFEIECWRSFADYLWLYLEDAMRAPAV